MNFQELQVELENIFPIAKALGAQVKELTGSKCRIELPLAPNSNHINTAFGGSIYCAAVIACYGLVKKMLYDRGFPQQGLLIQSGNIDYKIPIKDSISALCETPSKELVDEFFLKLTKKGRARLALNATIFDGKGSAIAAEFTGVYFCVK